MECSNHFVFMSSGGDSIRMCGFSAFFRCGMQYFDTMKVPRVLMPIIRSNRFMSVILRVGQADGAGIVDADVDAAEFGDGLVDRRDHLRLVADVAEHRQRLAAGGAHLVGGGVDRALQFRMRLRGLRGNRDIGAVARGAQRDRKPNAAAARRIRTASCL